MLYPRTLFLQHEQRRYYWDEPGHLELYIPMINSGVLGEVRTHPYQRDFRYFRQKSLEKIKNLPLVKEVVSTIQNRTQEEITNSGVIRELEALINQLSKNDLADQLIDIFGAVISEFKPDMVVYSLTWPDEAIPVAVLNILKQKYHFKLVSVIWDYDENNSSLMNYDRDIIAISDFVIVADSSFRTNQIRKQEGPYANFTNVHVAHFLPMIADPSIFQPSSEKCHEVSIAGSSEGYRVEVYNQLISAGINVNRIGGLMPEDKYIPYSEYAAALSKSRIVINTQTCHSRVQLKGRVSQVLASGSLLLEQYSSESEKFLGGLDLNSLMWENIDDLIVMIKSWLEKPNECDQFAIEARNRYFSKYNPKSWTQSILDFIF